MNVFRSELWGIQVKPDKWAGYLEAARNGLCYAWIVEGPTLDSLSEMETVSRKLFKAALRDPEWLRKAHEEV